MKKVLLLVLALALCAGCGLSFTGCSDNVQTETKYKIGIVQLVEHVALDAATEGFKQAVIDELRAENVEFLWNSVIESFIETYEKGGTPNPCVDCNKHIPLFFCYLHVLQKSL